MDLDRARELARAALGNLEAHRRRIDDLNVYPVPDGDTGTNLTLTVRAIVQAFEASTAQGHEAVAKELSRAALMGARGNSGVIFSQIVRGFAEVLGRREDVDGTVLAQAFRSASDAAYRAVRRPVEGTMLTVIRELADEAERPDVRALPKPEAWRRVVQRGEEALARTPDLLPVLKEAGVVDAGGAGLLEIVRGVAAAIAGEPLPEAPLAAEALGFDAIHQELSRYRYCTVFVVEGEGLDLQGLEAELERLGDSLLVVGDPSALKVHVHTDDPGAALALGTRLGVIEGVEIANMHAQTAEREQRLTAVLDDIPTLETAVVAVAPGAGNRRLFEQNPGEVVVVTGGQTMNPATADIVAAVDATRARQVVVLPNNKNVVATAEQAVALASKPMLVVPSRTVQEGLEAMLAYDATRPADENVEAMAQAIEQVLTGEVTRAVRDVALDGVEVREGAWLGLADGQVVASGDEFEAVAAAVVDRLLADGRDALTLLVGEGAPPLDGLLDGIEARYPLVDVARQEGGQPHYPLLLYA